MAPSIQPVPVALTSAFTLPSGEVVVAVTGRAWCDFSYASPIYALSVEFCCWNEAGNRVHTFTPPMTVQQKINFCELTVTDGDKLDKHTRDAILAYANTSGVLAT